MIKNIIKDISNRLGYEIRRNSAVGFNPEYLSRILQPRTVIDVGVGYGTPSLHKAFPKAHFILIEPLEEYRESIVKLAKKYSCEVHFKAVGEKNDKLEIEVDACDFRQSSFLSKTSLVDNGGQNEKRIVEVTTLDTIYKESSPIEVPILLKIDTEGYELAVLQGAKSLLSEVDMVIAEVSVARRFENGYEFEDIISFMSANGFYVYSFLAMYQKTGELRSRHTDVVFKRRD